jgi:hypothetical protein
MQDGVLQIRMPIADLQTRGRNIAVQEGHAATPALQQDDAAQALPQQTQPAQATQAAQPTATPPQSLH